MIMKNSRIAKTEQTMEKRAVCPNVEEILVTLISSSPAYFLPPIPTDEFIQPYSAYKFKYALSLPTTNPMV